MPRSEHANDDHLEDDHLENDHLDDVEDGCGCTEIWEHLSEQRADD